MTQIRHRMIKVLNSWRATQKASSLVSALSRKRTLAVLVVIATVLTVRLSLLPLLNYPVPLIPDEFSYLLLGDTFASGRITNPTHPLWRHFETLFIIHRPTYTSVYPLVQGLFLALGETFGGHPWFGVWISVGLMCGAICWMLQSWLPPRWAFFGGVLASVQLGIFGYWMNSYWGGAPAALGGALVYGALPRMRRRQRIRDAVILGAGVTILANSRPYEGLLVAIPAAAFLVSGWIRLKGSKMQVAIRRHIGPLLLTLTLAGTSTGYYFWRVTGNQFRTPYHVYIREYAAAPAFLWQDKPPIPDYRHPVLRDAHLSFLARYERLSSLSEISKASFWKVAHSLNVILGPVLILPLLMFPILIRNRRMRFLCAAAGFVFTGMFATVPFQPHYAAPVTGILFAVSLQSLRHLWLLKRYSNPTGRIVVPVMPLACLVLLFFQPTYGYRISTLVERNKILSELEATGKSYLVFVRYGSDHSLEDEWVYNEPDIDSAPVVWARDMGEQRNREALRYFRNRTALLLEPDEDPLQISPYAGRH